jgi:hypothetical protein
MKAYLKSPHDVGQTPYGRRQIFHLEKGTVTGPKLQGDFLPGGGDWFLIRSDGVGEVDVRGTIRTADDELIYVTYLGILNVDPPVWERIVKGDEVAADEYYYRITPRFQTGAERYAWLNDVLTIGIGQLSSPMGQWVCYDVYQVM